MKRPQFISYPKSGRTWLRYMLSTLDVAERIDFHHDGFEFNDAAKPPLDFDTAGRLARYGRRDRIVYLERDPRDVMVSLFHQVTGRFRDFFHYDGDLSDMLRDEYFGAVNLARFRAMWAEILTQRPYLHLRYEDVHADPEAALGKLVDYCGFRISAARIRDAVEAGRIDNMRRVEEQAGFSEPWLRPRNGHTKVRRGVVGGHADELSPDDLTYLAVVFELD